MTGVQTCALPIWQSSGAPLGQAAIHPARVQTQLAKASNRLMGIDAVGSATIGDNLGGGVKGCCHCIKPAKVELHGTRNVAHGKFILRPHVQQGHRAIRQSGSKFGPVHWLGCRAICQTLKDLIDTERFCWAIRPRRSIRTNVLSSVKR